MQIETMRLHAAEEEAGAPGYWLCARCRSPQSRALPICLECGEGRSESGHGRRRPIGWVLIGVAVAAACLLSAAGLVS